MPVTQSTYQAITNSTAGKGWETLSNELGVFVLGEDEFGSDASYVNGTVFLSVGNASQGYSVVGNNTQTYYAIEG